MNRFSHHSVMVTIVCPRRGQPHEGRVAFAVGAAVVDMDKAARFLLPSVAVVAGPASQASDPEITRHVTGPPKNVPSPVAGFLRDHSPTVPPSKCAAIVSRRGGVVP